jgi:hypothetical protein
MAIYTNLVSFFKLDNVADTVGSNTLTNTGSVTFSAGKVGNAASFGAANSSKKLSTGNDLGATGDYSISLWVKMLATPGTNALHPIASFSDAARHFENTLFYQDVSGTKYIGVNWNNTTSDDSIKYATTLGTTDWHHIAYSYNTTTKITRIFLNGNLVATGTGVANGASGYSDNFELAYSGHFNKWGSMMIDEVGVWSRVITPTEVAGLYKCGLNQATYPFPYAGILRDSFYTPTDQGAATSWTIAHTCTGENLALLVAVDETGSTTCTGVTYNGVAMTSLVDSAYGTGRHLYIFGLLNPATGTHNIVVSNSASTAGNVAAVSYTGVLLTADFPNTTATGTTTAAFTTTIDRCVTVVYGSNNVDAESTNSYSIGTIASGKGLAEGSSGVVTPAGSYSMVLSNADKIVGVALTPITSLGGGLLNFF